MDKRSRTKERVINEEECWKELFEGGTLKLQGRCKLKCWTDVQDYKGHGRALNNPLFRVKVILIGTNSLRD